MDALARIEDLIVTGSEGFFDEPDSREDLHVTIRIARDFYDFLERFGERPPVEEVHYIIGTIRSGIDGFFALAYLCKSLDTGRETWTFGRHLHWDFSALREEFMRSFEHLAESSDASVVERLASLLVLTHLQLVFFAQHFPSAIIR